MGVKRTCPTTEEFIALSREKHGTKYDYSLTEVATLSGKVRIVCPKHGEFLQQVNYHLRGCECFKCGVEKSAKSHTLTTESFIAKAKTVHGDRFDYADTAYVNSSTKISFRCAVHGQISALPFDHLNGGCPRCGIAARAKAKRSSAETFIAKAKEIHGGTYDYSAVEYSKSTSKVKIICKDHGVFEQEANSHLQGKGCAKCGMAAAGNSTRYTFSDFISKAKAIHGGVYDYSQLEYVDSVTHVKVICNTHGEFFQRPAMHLQGQGCPLCSVSGPSRPEIEMAEYIASIANTVTSDRAAISPFEIDCLAIDARVGFEFCGLYFHSDAFRPPRYHLDKLNRAISASLGLVQIFEDEWYTKQPIVKSIISNRLGTSKAKVFARKTKISELDKSSSAEFLNANHIQGWADAPISIGLLFEERLIMVATFSPQRRAVGGLDKGWFELVRLCTELNTQVLGGLSKLLKYFIRKYSPAGVKTFCDRRLFDGSGYEAVGFKLKGFSRPAYHYVKNKRRYSRYAFQKHKLSDKLENFDPELSESKNMTANGYRRIYDCGHAIYVMPLATP
jgi:ribosomal protein L37E